MVGQPGSGHIAGRVGEGFLPARYLSGALGIHRFITGKVLSCGSAGRGSRQQRQTQGQNEHPLHGV